MMKKITFVLLLAFLVFNCNTLNKSQKTEMNDSGSLQASFNKDATAFFNHLNESNWGGMMDMMYPKIFDIATRDQMTSAMNQMAANGMKMSVKDIEIYKISEPVVSENEMFRKLNYKADMIIKLSGDMAESGELMMENFKEVYGEDNVKFDKNASTFFIKSDKVLLAISKVDKPDWKYLEFNESQPQMLKKLLPEAVYEEFKSK